VSERREFPLDARKKILSELSEALDRLQEMQELAGNRRAQEALVVLAGAIGRLRFYAEVSRKGRP
jgi:hypothetical protein